MTIDSNNHLWVAEEDFQPKRVSIWTLDGRLVKGFAGSAEYGGGGSLDPTDKTKYYYHGMEFKLDWKAGTDSIAAVLYRPGKDDIPLPRFSTPTTVLYSHGHRYFDNSFAANTTNGVDFAILYLDTGGILHPVAALGKATPGTCSRPRRIARRLAAEYQLPRARSPKTRCSLPGRIPITTAKSIPTKSPSSKA